MFSEEKLSKFSETFFLEPSVHPSVRDSVEIMITLIQKQHSHSEKYISVKASQKTQKIGIYFANERSVLACLLRRRVTFGIIVGNKSGLLLRRRGPHILEFEYDLVCPDSLMTYTELID